MRRWILPTIPKAWQSLQRAVALAPKASARERAFIHALEARYAENPPADRRALDEAYAKATGALVAQHPTTSMPRSSTPKP